MSERKTWLQEEDRILRELVEQRKITGWAEIARVMTEEFHITGRSGKQCRQRYHNHLDTRIKHGPWSRQEEQLLVDLQNSFGNRWAQIARAIAGRSQNTVKNKYFSIVRRGVRVLNMAIRRQLKKYKELEMSTIRQIVDAYDPTFPAHSLNPEQLSCGQIKKRLIFYSLRDENLPLASEDYLDIKKLIDLIRMFKKKHNAGNRLENSTQMSMEESLSRVSEQKIEGSEEHRVRRFERQEKCEEGVDHNANSEEQRQQRAKVNNCILELNKISLQSFNFQPLPQQIEEQLQDKELNCSQLISPIMSKRFSSFSNKSNRSLFSFREGENQMRGGGELLRKDATLRSFQLPQVQQYRSPFMMIDSPHFDQLRGSFNSWSSYLYHH